MKQKKRKSHNRQLRCQKCKKIYEINYGRKIPRFCYACINQIRYL